MCSLLVAASLLVPGPTVLLHHRKQLIAGWAK